MKQGIKDVVFLNNVQIWQMVLLVTTNLLLLLGSFYPIPAIIGLFVYSFMISVFRVEPITGDSLFSFDGFCLLIALFVGGLIVVAHFFILPLLYKYLEKNSNYEIIQKFIYNLKNSNKFRIKFLLYISIPIFVYLLFIVGKDFWTVLTIDINYTKFFQTMNIVSGMKVASVTFGEMLMQIVISMIMFDLLGSYIVLFLWWKLRGELR